MPEFETILKLLVLIGGGSAILLGSGSVLKALLKKPPPDPMLDERLADAERRLADLEVRADFAERVLSEVRERRDLPGA